MERNCAAEKIIWKGMKKIFSTVCLLTFVFLSKTKAQNNASVFEGKNLVTFGNSITAAENSWAYQLSKALKFGNLYNGAVGGAIWSKRERTTGSGLKIKTQNYSDPGFAGLSNGNVANPDDQEFQKRINNCAIVHIQKYLSQNAPTPDFIILSYGTNDPASTATLGDATHALEESNLNNLDVNTLAGAVKWCLKTLQTRFPHAKLYVSLPLQAASENKNSDNLKKIDIITKICKGMSVPYFNCYAECGITQQNSKQYLRDGLHPNEAGKQEHAQYIIRKLKEAD
jgi:lysophospholipase L1-like esterase